MPLLSSLSSSAPPKITSPPSHQQIEEPGAFSSARRSSAGASGWSSYQHGDEDATLLQCSEPVASLPASTAAKSARRGVGAGLRTVAYALAAAAGIVTLHVIYESHHSSSPWPAQVSNARRDVSPHHLVRTNEGNDDDDDDDDEEDGWKDDGIDRVAAGDEVLRAVALEELAADLDLLRAHEVRRAVHGELNMTLRVAATRFANGPIAFWTRTYEHSIPAPMLSLRPGDTLHLHQINELGPNEPGAWSPNTYHDPNSTNIHVHGMHVDPTGISDNVLRTLAPGETMDSKIRIPENHPSGVSYYHPHYHGSVNIQIAGGMAGAIVVEDDEDSLPAEYKHMRRHVVMLQEFRFDGGPGSDLRQIAEFSRSRLEMRPEYTPKVLLDEQVRTLFPYIARTPQTTVEGVGISAALKAHRGHRGRPPISRFFVANGQFLPKLEVQPNENVLLRLVNAGNGATLELAIPGCTMHVIAQDGIYLRAPRLSKLLLLSSGGRADIVLRCLPPDSSDPHRESLRPLFSKKDVTVNSFLGAGTDVFQGIVAFVHVSGPSRDMPVVKRAPPVPALYARDLPAPSTAPFRFEFSMSMTKQKKDGFMYKQYFINHVPFNLTSMRNLTLGAVDEWVIVNDREEDGSDATKNHPFHIHTNAFQIVAISHGAGVDYEVGDWRDVIAVPTPGNVTIRLKPMDFVGRIVAHCHITGHSDMGMVALVDIFE
ncbi:hypothetical protein ATCC90586_006268 [Pythium insidiosum]|nr:hypothetical protein ATCC90586_006268 [Pythium insidiosum]